MHMQVAGNLPDLPEVARTDQAREDDLARQRKACWDAFKGAADAFLERGDTTLARNLIDATTARFGPVVGEQQRRELWNWIKARSAGSKGRR